MKNLFVSAVAVAAALPTGAGWAQSGHMMGGGHWGSGWMVGSGGVWVPVLIVVVALVAWIVMQKRK